MFGTIGVFGDIYAKSGGKEPIFPGEVSRCRIARNCSASAAIVAGRFVTQRFEKWKKI